MRVITLLLCVPVILCGFVLSGCSSVKSPGFRVMEAELTSESADGYVVTFVLEGENENDFPLPLREVEYRLAFEGDAVFSGRRSAEATLPAGSTGRVVLPVSVSFAETGGVVPATIVYELSGEVTYVVPGAIAELLFDSQIKKPRVGFAERGELVGG